LPVSPNKDMKKQPTDITLIQHTYGTLIIRGGRMWDTTDMEIMLTAIEICIGKNKTVMSFNAFCRAMWKIPTSWYHRRIYDVLDDAYKKTLIFRKDGGEIKYRIFELIGKDSKTKHLAMKMTDTFKQQLARYYSQMDRRFLAGLSMSLSKVIYFFLQGQRGFMEHGFLRIGLLKFCKVLNKPVPVGINAMNNLRYEFRQAIKELSKMQYLKSKSHLSDDIVNFYKRKPLRRRQRRMRTKLPF